MVALAAVAAIAAGTGYALTATDRGPAQTITGRGTRPGTATRAGHATQQATLAAKVLHVAAARLAREAATAEPAPGQWIYYTEVDESGANSHPSSEGPEWVTFDGDQSAYYEVGGPFVVHTSSTSFPPPGTNPWVALNTYGIHPQTAWNALAALPADPHALLAVIAHQVATPAGEQFAAASVTTFGGPRQPTREQLEFDYLTRILWNAYLGAPPAALAAVYRAMATLPGISVQPGIKDTAGGQAIGVSDDDGYDQLLIDPVSDQVIGIRQLSTGIGPVTAAQAKEGKERQSDYPAKGTLIYEMVYARTAEVPAPGDR